ncbi:pimeloyl-ACP methyl ester carboxylesterase [Amycolatopsis lexingtonensis]|uniref:Pimeloyl-ACP methyl ester carboxylesterase n=1 Tax=Amycolatopsis lexingtonensis TaxID=218822 RepID=A0ABR9HYF5_9PSEU|nr:alpha/beta fold hydrolase [Amycolatopsis lexingtonensis]MBE1495954.1 pimeloyl-ACP methyl ester carboxylesterase [Amycolatopsis lexingtonensis]
MPAVFVHGNPETAAVWDLLLAELAPVRPDLVCLSPPGFGAPLPAGFGATRVEYRDWLIGELEAFGEPVDLVGHDLGGGHVVNVVLSRPDLVRSWVSDGLGMFDPGYEWHELARRWRTPGVGEADVAQRFGGTAEARTAVLVERGMGEAVAARVAAGQDEVMGRAVLSVYRSAGEPGLGLPLERAAVRPGLAILATADDVVGSEAQRRRAAARAGARVAVLAGMGHWWMTHDPARAAAVLTGFWATLG